MRFKISGRWAVKNAPPRVSSPAGTRALTAAEFRGLAAVPPALEWFANLPNARTRRAYQQDVRDFTRFVGIVRPEDFRTVTRAHLIAWREHLTQRGVSPRTVQNRLAVVSLRFQRRCEKQVASRHPVAGVRRPLLRFNGFTHISLGLYDNALNSDWLLAYRGL